MKKYPYYLIFAALYPVISLYVLNVSEINLIYIIRPVLAALVGMAVIFGLFKLILRNSQKAAIASTIGFLIFCSYGALFNVIKGLSIGGVTLGNHRFLLPVVIILTVIILWFVTTRMKPPYTQIYQGFNTVLGALILFSVVQLGFKYNQIKLPSQSTNNPAIITTQATTDLPDVYYFMLDSYPRADYIKKFMEYDNTPFLNALKQRGFYIADCSMSNYSFTRLSQATTLNMEYFEDLGLNVSRDDKDESRLDPYILHPKIRTDLEKAGYSTVAFETGYPFTEWSDADYFFRSESNPLTMPVLTAFENMLIQNTGISAALNNQQIRRLLGFTFPYYEKWSREHYIIDQTKNIPDLPGPKFVYIHLVTTHRPYIFKPDGSILNDERYYLDDGVPINDEFYIRGFQYQLEFTNDYLLDLIDTIIADSKIPPVIILQGDHGVRAPGRHSILNALLVPNLKDTLYPALSPVNNFRVVENSILGTSLDLLEDATYFSNTNVAPYKLRPIPNDNPCKIQ